MDWCGEPGLSAALMMTIFRTSSFLRPEQYAKYLGPYNLRNYGITPALGNSALHFNSGSTLQLTTNQPLIPAADYDPNSLIYISGVVNNPVSNEEPNFVGNLTYACPNQADSLSLGMSGMTIGGNLFITNTNSYKLRIFWDGVSGPGPFTNTINGSLQVSGPSKFLISRAVVSGISYNLQINGNLIMSGEEFDMQNRPNTSTNLFVRGNIQHTAGIFTARSVSTSSTANYFNIELNGTGNQTLSSVNGILDNDNLQVNLRINKPTGSVALATPIAVGRLTFASGNNANINTGVHLLSIRTAATANPSIALGYGGTGFVEGNLQRSFATTAPVIFPLGTGTTYRPLIFNPSSSASSIYQASQVNGPHPTAIGVLPPLSGVAPYYWSLTKNSGADGNVELTLNGQVPGATSGDALVAAKLAANNWVNARGSTGTSIFDGSVTTGTVRTEPQTSYGYYTIGYGSHAALPVILTAFNAKKVSATAADITWKITENSTPEMFDVMRSSDGLNFTTIGSTPGIKGKFSYAFTDNKLLNGNNYYKLQMHDRDGSITHSTIVVVMNGSRGVIISSLMPTLVQDRAKLMVSSSLAGTMQLVVTDISGRIIQQQQVSINPGNQEVWLNASHLAAGMFQVTGYINGEKTSTFRFIKR